MVSKEVVIVNLNYSAPFMTSQHVLIIEDTIGSLFLNCLAKAFTKFLVGVYI